MKYVVAILVMAFFGALFAYLIREIVRLVKKTKALREQKKNLVHKDLNQSSTEEETPPIENTIKEE